MICFLCFGFSISFVPILDSFLNSKSLVDSVFLTGQNFLTMVIIVDFFRLVFRYTGLFYSV